MRVLHIGKYQLNSKGGIEAFLLDLVRQQAAHGHEVAVIVHAKPGASARSPILPANVRCYIVPTLGQILYTAISPMFPWHLHQALREFDPDIVHLHAPNAAAFAALLIPSARCRRWILHWHADLIPVGNRPLLSLLAQAARPLEYLLLRKSNMVVVTSTPYLLASRSLARWQNRCRVVPLGLDPRRLSFDEDDLAWAEAQWAAGPLRILFVGRLAAYKGLHVLREAISIATGVQCCVTGTGEMAHTLPPGERFVLLGEVEDARRNALLHTTDVVVLPSTGRSEAFGIVLLEAMASGRCVVASDIPGSGTGWVVKSNKGGLLVPPGDAMALASALNSLAAQPELRAQLAAAGRARFEDLFHIDKVTTALDALYSARCTPEGTQ